MEKYNRLWRSFYALGIIVISLQQLFWRDFRPVVIPPGPDWLVYRIVWVWLLSILLISAGVYIILGIKGRSVSIALGTLFLLLIIIFQVPYTLGHHPAHLFSWTDPLKELVFSGGAFVVAGSYNTDDNPSSPVTNFFGRLIPYGKCGLGITMVIFGIDHFFYTDFIVPLVPLWIPGPVFWTYFGGVALIAGGLGILFGIRIAASLSGLMLFTWFIILHIPRAIADPHSGNGNEWSSVFEAFAFSGIAFLIAARPRKTR